MWSVRANPRIKRWVRRIRNDRSNPIDTSVAHHTSRVALAVFTARSGCVARVDELLTHRQRRVYPVTVKKGVRAHRELGV